MRSAGNLLMRVRLPTEATAIVILRGQTAIVIVVYRYRIAVAGHDGVGVFQHHIAVEQVSIRRTRAASAHLLVLPPSLQACMGNVVDVHYRPVTGGGVGRIQLRIVVAADIFRRAESHAIVVANARRIAGTPLAVQVRQVKVQPGVAGPLHAFYGIGRNVGLIFGIEVEPVHCGGLPRREHFVGADILRRGGRLGRQLQHRLNDRVTGLWDGQNVELQQTNTVHRTIVLANLHVVFSIRRHRRATAKGRILNVVYWIRGVDDGIDGHGIRRFRYERRINGICHADVIPAIGERNLRKGLLAICIVDDRGTHVEQLRAGCLVQHFQLLAFGHCIIKVLWQPQRGIVQRLCVGKDDVLLDRLAIQSVAHRDAGQYLVVIALRTQVGDVGALFLFSLQFRFEIRCLQAGLGSADEPGQLLRQLDEPLLLQLTSGVDTGLYGKNFLFKAPGKGPVTGSDRGHTVAIRLQRKFHSNTIRAVAEDLTTLRRGKRLQSVVDFLPFVGIRIAEMNGFRVHHRLIAVGAHIEVFHARLTAGNIFMTDRLNKISIHAFGILSLLREAQERLLAVLLFLVFHCFSPFLLDR